MPGRRYPIKKKHKSSKYRRNIKSHKNKNKSRKNLRTQRGGTISSGFLATLESDYDVWMSLYKTINEQTILPKEQTILPKEHYITYKLYGPSYYYIVIKEDMFFESYKRLDVPTSINNNQENKTPINFNGLTVIEIVNDNDQNKVNKYTKIIDILKSIPLKVEQQINSELEILTEQTTKFLTEYKDIKTLERGNYFIFKISQYNYNYIAIVSSYNCTMADLVKLASLLPQNNNNSIFNATQLKVSIYKINIDKGTELRLERDFYKLTDQWGAAQHTQTIYIGKTLTFEDVVIEGITLNNNIPIGVSKEILRELYTKIIDKNLTLFNKLSENEHLEIVGEPGRCSRFISEEI